MRYVLDCSVAVKWLVPEPLSDVALSVLDGLRAGTMTLLAPETIIAEMGHALRKLVLGRELAPGEAQALLDDFMAIQMQTVPVRPLAAEALRLCVAHLATYYDALYLALALREEVAVLTADERMANAFAPLKRTLLLRDLQT